MMKEVLVRPKEKVSTVIYLDEIEKEEKHFFGMLAINGIDKYMLSNHEGDYFWVGMNNLLTKNKYTYSCIISACNPGKAGAKIFKFESGEELIKWLSRK